MRALHNVVQAGLVRYIGMSSCHAYQCESNRLFSFPDVFSIIIAVHNMQGEGLTVCHPLFSYQVVDYATQHNLTPFISMQNHYSLLYREEEREMFPTLKVASFTSCLHGALAHLFKSTLASRQSHGPLWHAESSRARLQSKNRRQELALIGKSTRLSGLCILTMLF